MNTINDIFQSYGQKYLDIYGDSVPYNHKKVIDAITNCRTDKYGFSVYECKECGEVHTVFRSCGNRHCPACQNHKTKQWLDKQMQYQIPGHHFMLTFTLPEQIRDFVRSNQDAAYSAMFKTSSQSIKKLAKDEKYIGGDLTGFFGVLHTWGRMIQYHPHIHYVVSGGALSKKNKRWHSSRIDFFLPVKALSKIFKAKFRDEMKKLNLYDEIPEVVWKMNWIVNCQAVGNAHNCVKYLAAYVFKVAISNNRIVKVENDRVFFKYRKQNSRRWRITSLDVMEFIRRYLQHVLPPGFMKVRYYGFMNPNSSVTTDEISALIELAYGFDIDSPKRDNPYVFSLYCPNCGGVLNYLYSVLPFMTGYG
jgi:hypothetical protein